MIDGDDQVSDTLRCLKCVANLRSHHKSMVLQSVRKAACVNQGRVIQDDSASVHVEIKDLASCKNCCMGYICAFKAVTTVIRRSSQWRHYILQPAAAGRFLAGPQIRIGMPLFT